MTIRETILINAEDNTLSIRHFFTIAGRREFIAFAVSRSSNFCRLLKHSRGRAIHGIKAAFAAENLPEPQKFNIKSRAAIGFQNVRDFTEGGTGIGKDTSTSPTS